MQEALDDLVKLLDLEPIEVNLFRGRSPDAVSYTHLTLPTIYSV